MKWPEGLNAAPRKKGLTLIMSSFLTASFAAYPVSAISALIAAPSVPRVQITPATAGFWAKQVREYLSNPTNHGAMLALVPTLNRLDLNDPAVRADIEPITREIQEMAERILPDMPSAVAEVPGLRNLRVQVLDNLFREHLSEPQRTRTRELAELHKSRLSPKNRAMLDATMQDLAAAFGTKDVSGIVAWGTGHMWDDHAAGIAKGGDLARFEEDMRKTTPKAISLNFFAPDPTAALDPHGVVSRATGHMMNDQMSGVAEDVADRPNFFGAGHSRVEPDRFKLEPMKLGKPVDIAFTDADLLGVVSRATGLIDDSNRDLFRPWPNEAGEASHAGRHRAIEGALRRELFSKLGGSYFTAFWDFLRNLRR